MPTWGTQADKFNRNLVATRIISAVLGVEQLVYGLVLSDPGSIRQRVYFASSLLVFLICIVAWLVPKAQRLTHPILIAVFEWCVPATGMAVALARIAFQEGLFTSFPTIFLAILYGSAVVFLLNYRQSIILYSVSTIAAMLIIPRFREISATMPFKSDLAVNSLVAWIISAFNYRYFAREQTATRVIQEQNLQLAVLAEHDWLTGLYNRRKMDALLSKRIEQAQKSNSPLSLVLFDLDWFKDINDTYGHQAGDQVLRELAKILRAAMQQGDEYARWGGEEFLVLTSRSAHEVAQTLREAIDLAKFPGDIHLTASFGIATCTAYTTEVELLRKADRMLYLAKEHGRNRVEPSV